MNSDKQRIAIAEAMGWTLRKCRDGYNAQKILWFEPHYGKTREADVDYAYGEDELPDYFNDLNACHEMEQSLILQELAADYWREIHKTRGITWGFHATAEQRCEAFLRTVGGWEDE